MGQGDGLIGERVVWRNPGGEWALVHGLRVSLVVERKGDRQRGDRLCGSDQFGVDGGLTGNVRQIDIEGQDRLGCRPIRLKSVLLGYE